MATELCTMPIAKYQQLCETIRAKAGTDATVKSGDMADLIAGIEIGVDCSDATATELNVAYGKTYYGADGLRHTGARHDPQLYTPTGITYAPLTHTLTVQNNAANGKFGLLYITIGDGEEKQVTSPYTLNATEQAVFASNEENDHTTRVQARYKASGFTQSGIYQADLKGKYKLTISPDAYSTISATVTRNGQSVTLTNGADIWLGEVIHWTAAVTDPTQFRLVYPTSDESIQTVIGDTTLMAASIALGVYAVLNAGVYVIPHVTFTGYPTVTEGYDYGCTLTADNGYHLPNTVDVYVGARKLTSGYTYNSATGAVVIDHTVIDGNIRIYAAVIPNTYTLYITTSHAHIGASVQRNNVAVALGNGSSVTYGEVIHWCITSVDYGYEIEDVGVDKTETVSGDTYLLANAVPISITVTGYLAHLTMTTIPANPKYKTGVTIYLTPDTYYMTPTRLILVKIGGNTYTGYTYDFVNSTVTIPYTDVTGDIDVYASAIGIETELTVRVGSHLSAVLSVVRNGITENLYDESFVRVGEVIHWECTANIGWKSLSGYSGDYTVYNSSPSIIILETYLSYDLTVTIPSHSVIAVNYTGGVAGAEYGGYYQSNNETQVTIRNIPHGSSVEWQMLTSLIYVFVPGSGSFTMTDDVSFSVAQYSKQSRVYINTSNAFASVTVTRNGQLTSLSDGAVVYYGETLNVSAMANMGYHFASSIPSSITVSGEDVTINANAVKNVRVVHLNGIHCTIYAYYLSSATQITPITDGAFVEEGTTIYWSITAVDEGYGIDGKGVKLGSAGTDNIPLGVGTHATEYTLTLEAYPPEVTCDLNTQHCSVSVAVIRDGHLTSLASNVRGNASFIAYPGESLIYQITIDAGYAIRIDGQLHAGYYVYTDAPLTMEDTLLVPKYIMLHAAQI